MTQLITASDRKHIIEQLTAFAPDELLVDAYNRWWDVRSATLLARRRIAAEGEEGISAPVEPLVEQKEVAVVERQNVDPGRPSIGKIGTDTKASLLAMLKEGKQPPAKFSEHMKLLWVRDEVRFDGKEYWL